jgi:hypothetical protein
MREATGPAQIRRLMLDNILRRLQRADRERGMRAITKNYTRRT